MQKLFNKTASTGGYEAAVDVDFCDTSNAYSSLGGKFNASPAAGAEMDGMLAAQMRNSASAQPVVQAENNRDETWLSGIAYKALSSWHYNKHKHPSALVGSKKNSLVEMGAAAWNGTKGLDRQLQLIQAMIAAARADGHVDATESERILTAINDMGVLPDAKAALFELLDQPITADVLAPSSNDIEWKAEIYLASCMAIDSYHRSELAYLGELESVLELPDGLAQKLQWHARRTNRVT